MIVFGIFILFYYFTQDCQQHRNQYIDQTGTVRRVELFVLPKLTADIRSNKKFINRYIFFISKFLLTYSRDHHQNIFTNFIGKYFVEVIFQEWLLWKAKMLSHFVKISPRQICLISYYNYSANFLENCHVNNMWIIRLYLFF